MVEPQPGRSWRQVRRSAFKNSLDFRRVIAANVTSARGDVLLLLWKKDFKAGLGVRGVGSNAS